MLVQPTSFQPTRTLDPDKRVEFQTLYQELIDDQTHSENLRGRRRLGSQWAFSKLILTERNDHLDRFEHELASRVDHVVVLRAGMGKKQRQAVNERLGHPATRSESSSRPANTLARDSTTHVWTRCF